MFFQAQKLNKTIVQLGYDLNTWYIWDPTTQVEYLHLAAMSVPGTTDIPSQNSLLFQF